MTDNTTVKKEFFLLRKTLHNRVIQLIASDPLITQMQLEFKDQLAPLLQEREHISLSLKDLNHRAEDFIKKERENNNPIFLEKKNKIREQILKSQEKHRLYIIKNKKNIDSLASNYNTRVVEIISDEINNNEGLKKIRERIEDLQPKFIQYINTWKQDTITKIEMTMKFSSKIIDICSHIIDDINDIKAYTLDDMLTLQDKEGVVLKNCTTLHTILKKHLKEDQFRQNIITLTQSKENTKRHYIPFMNDTRINSLVNSIALVTSHQSTLDKTIKIRALHKILLYDLMDSLNTINQNKQKIINAYKDIDSYLLNIVSKETNSHLPPHKDIAITPIP